MVLVKVKLMQIWLLALSILMLRLKPIVSHQIIIFFFFLVDLLDHVCN